MMIWITLFWLAVIVGLVWLVRYGVDRSQQTSESSALAILDRRFAEGAVSLDEYWQRRDVLTGAAPRPAPDVTTSKSGRSQR